VIAPDDGDGPGWAKQPTKRSQGSDLIGKVFKHQTDKDVIEGFRRERQIKEVGRSWTSRGERERLGRRPRIPHCRGGCPSDRRGRWAEVAPVSLPAFCLCLEGLCRYERRIAELECLARAATPALGQSL
jgi:hypothetical protein